MYIYNGLLPVNCCYYLVSKSCPILHDPMDCSMPGLSVPHYLLEFAQVHVHCISDAVQHLVNNC